MDENGGEVPQTEPVSAPVPVKDSNALIYAAQDALRDNSVSLTDKLTACEAAFPYLRNDNGEFVRQFALLIFHKNGVHTEQALNLLLQAIALCPNDAGMWAELAAAYAHFARFDDALRCCDESLRLNPNQNTARWNRSLELLARGQFIEGWNEYRYGNTVGNRPVRAPYPEWDGKPIGQETLYVWCEQGLGDSIQMLRFIKEVREMAGEGAKIIVEIQPELLPIFGTIDGADQVVVIHPSMAFQCGVKDPHHVSLMSLPRIFGWGVGEWYGASQFPYDAGFYGRTALPTGPIKVGLVWQGRATHGNDKARSADITVMKAISDACGDGFQFVSLQYGADKNDTSITNMAYPDLTTFAETAQVIMGLDIVVGVDTGVCHLAGAMGCPVQLMLSKVTDWRWGRDTALTNWYPNHRLIRQQNIGDWSNVIETVVSQLKKFQRITLPQGQ